MVLEHDVLELEEAVSALVLLDDLRVDHGRGALLELEVDVLEVLDVALAGARRVRRNQVFLLADLLRGLLKELVLPQDLVLRDRKPLIVLCFYIF